MAGRAGVYVVVVTYRCDELLEECLASLAAQAPDVDLEVVVVDNASSSPTRLVVERHTGARYVDACGNLGFARANNIGVREYSSGPLLLVNPDIVIPPGTLRRLLRAFEEFPDVGVVGPKLIRADGELDHACKRGLPSLSSSLAYFLKLDRVAPAQFGAYRAADLAEDEEGNVEAINGAFMLVREEAYRAVGQLDERFWMYGEDLDWCIRFAQAGWKIRYVPTPVIHVKSGAAGSVRGMKTSWAFHRAMWLFYRKHHVTWVSVPLAAGVFAGIHLKFVASLGVSMLKRVKLLRARPAISTQ